MPISRIVIGRITKVEDKNDKKWFHFSMRKSIVTYGSNQLNRENMQEGNIVECIVLTFVDGKVFAQIKGTYLKLKVKNIEKVKLNKGDHINVKLLKVTK